MWSDKELDEAFRRLAPSEPEPAPFPLDGWLGLETKLDKLAMERLFRRRLWRFFLGEMAVVAVAALVWLAWPARQTHKLVSKAHPALTASKLATMQSGAASELASRPAARPTRTSLSHRAAAEASVAAAMATAHSSAAAGNVESTTAPVAPTASNVPAGLASAGKATPTPPGKHGHFAGPSATSGTVATADSAAITNLRGLAIASIAPVTKRHSNQVAKDYHPISHFLVNNASKNAQTRRTLLPGKSVLTAANAGRPAEQAKAASANFRTSRQTHRQLASQAPAIGHSSRNTSVLFSKDAGEKQTIDSSPSDLSARNAFASSRSIADQTDATPTGVAEIFPLAVALLADSATQLPSPLTTLPIAPASPLPEPLRQPRLYLGLVGAPDVSTVKMADFQAPTANVGITLEYRLLDRLRVTTGFLRGTKNYRARRQDYDWSYYPIAANGNFEWVDGSCTIIDVPLNLRYDALVRPQYQLFGSAGLSSLFMQHETYAYDYKYYGNDYHWQRSYTNENQHWLSVLNLSVGYERSLSRHWRVQAEPYVKLPLGGVGAGKVRLASGGVFFGVKYGF